MTGRRGLLVGEVTTESGHINLSSINTGNIHVHRSTRIGFPKRVTARECCYGCYALSLTQSCLVTIFR